MINDYFQQLRDLLSAPPPALFAGLLMASIWPMAPLATASPAMHANRGVAVTRATFDVAVYPKKHQIKVRARMMLESRRPVAKLKLFLPQIIELQTLSISPSKGVKAPVIKRHKRELASVDVVFAKAHKGRFGLELRYHITFHSRKNYLFRAIFCRIDPDETYLLYGWYPSLQPFADPMTGRLLGAKRYPYTLTIDTPADQWALSSGRLLRRKLRKGGRAVHTYRQSPIKEAAIFFSVSRFRRRKVRTRAGTALTFYLGPQDKGRNIKRLTRMMARAQRLYERLWGRPVSDQQAKAGADRRWKLISFGGSGARGYPFSLLLDRRQDYFDGDLDGAVDSLFTRRQILLHEMAHTWWGNAVTGVGKGSIWLNEGLANYASLRAIGALYGARAEAAAVARHVRYFLRGSGGGALLAPGGLAQMAGRVAYTKGALLFYELERRLGRGVLERGLRRYFQQNRGKFATIAKLKAALEHVAGRSLAPFFRDWVHGDALPFLQMKGWRCATKGPKGCLLELTLSNSGSIAGSAVIVATSPKGKRRTLHHLVPPGQGHRPRLKLPFVPTKVQLDPQGVMLHGLRLKALMSKANRLRRSGQQGQALPLFRRLIKLAPRHGQALYSFGLLQQKRHKWKAAMALFQRAARQKAGPQTPSWVPLWSRFRYAALIHKRGDAKQRQRAARIFRQLLAQPHDVYGLKARVKALQAAPR